jgi:GntR family transcriptional regulator
VFVRVESSSGVPITRQIADQIRSQCASGALAPGDRMPSVRQLARELTVNQNTILRVYERLTAEGLLDRRQGDGTYVADSLPRGRVTVQRDLLQGEVDRVAHRAMDLAVTSEEVHEMLDESFLRLEKERGISKKGQSS